MTSSINIFKGNNDMRQLQSHISWTAVHVSVLNYIYNNCQRLALKCKILYTQLGLYLISIMHCPVDNLLHPFVHSYIQNRTLTLNIPSLARQRCLPSWGPRRTPWFFFCNFLTVWCGRLLKLCFLGFWNYNSVIQALLVSNILCLFISTEVSQ